MEQCNLPQLQRTYWSSHFNLHFLCNMVISWSVQCIWRY